MSPLTDDARRSLMAIVIIAALLGGVLMTASLATAQAQPEPVHNPTNGHHYEAIAVVSGIDWASAKAAAEARSFHGCQGHLVAVTSLSENAFIVAAFPQAAAGVGNRDFYWLGGSQPPPFEVPGSRDPDPAAGWEWVTGEPFSFTNWASGEPNDSSALTENVVAFWFPSGSGRWNDLPRVLDGVPLIQRGYVVEYSCVEVAIDIKPGGEPNSINPDNRGNIPVAILSAEGFDATTEIDRESLTFGSTGYEDSLLRCNDEDVNDDGLPDLVCHFRTRDTGFTDGDSSGHLRGMTSDGEVIVGADSVRIVP
jgi:hypothetical protein